MASSRNARVGVAGCALLSPLPCRARMRGASAGLGGLRQRSSSRRRAAACRATGSALNPATPIAQYGRDVWDSDSGLPQNSVDAILQTRDGYLWLGTQEGLVRVRRRAVHDLRYAQFARDARRLGQSALCRRPAMARCGSARRPGSCAGRTAPLSERQPARRSLRAVVTELYESREGVLWAATSQGARARQRRGGPDSGTEDGLRDRLVQAIGEDSGGNLWSGSRGGLARFEVCRFTIPPGSRELPGAGDRHRHGPAGRLLDRHGQGARGAERRRDARLRRGRRARQPAGAGPVPGPRGHAWVGTARRPLPFRRRPLRALLPRRRRPSATRSTRSARTGREASGSARATAD